MKEERAKADLQRVFEPAAGMRAYADFVSAKGE